MKTIIDSKQAERLKEVCEKHGVKLPRTDHIGIPAPDDNVLIVYDTDHLIDGIAILSLTDLLDWVLPSLTITKKYGIPIIYDFSFNKWLCDCGIPCGSVAYCIEDDDNCDYVEVFRWGEGEDFPEAIDALLELFIWTITEGHYKGVE